MVTKRYITIPEFAKMLGISRIAVYKKVKSGQIPAEKIGRNYVISDRVITRILTGKISSKDERRVDATVRKTVREYGEVLKRLGRE
jgi:excisionase family DNA binding protein